MLSVPSEIADTFCFGVGFALDDIDAFRGFCDLIEAVLAKQAD